MQKKYLKSSLVDKLISFFDKGKLSTSVIADCSTDFKYEVLDFEKQIKFQKAFSGYLFFTYTYKNSNWDLHRIIRNKKFKNHVILVYPFECKSVGLLGGLISSSLKRKQAKGVLVNGFIRDVDEIKKSKLNVLCKGFSPVNVSKEMPKNKISQKKLFAVEKKYNKSVAFIDDSGCILIKIKNINENFIQKISEKLKLEKKWFNKLNKGMETFDITCQK